MIDSDERELLFLLEIKSSNKEALFRLRENYDIILQIFFIKVEKIDRGWAVSAGTGLPTQLEFDSSWKVAVHSAL